MENRIELAILAPWFRAISEVLGVNVILDEERICSLQIGEERIIIEITPDCSVLNIFSYVLPLPDDDPDFKLALMIKALEINAFQNLISGGAVAVAPGYEFLIYSRSLKINETTQEQFMQMFHSVLEIAPTLRDALLGRFESPQIG